MARTRKRPERTSNVLSEMCGLFPNRAVLASLLGISVKSLERYVYGAAEPKPARHRAMLHALAGRVDAAYIARLGVAMGVPEREWPARAAESAPHASPSLEDALELCVFAAAERHGVAPAAGRGLALDVLARVIELGATPAVAHAALRVIEARRAPPAG
jgi:hypothetical protein